MNKNEGSVEDQVVTVTLARREGKTYITGLYGTKAVKGLAPLEIGICVVEVMTGEFNSPPVNYRETEEFNRPDPRQKEKVDAPATTTVVALVPMAPKGEKE